MSQPDYRGARGSNAGDDFHELWALRQALALLDHGTTLSGITVEGVIAEKHDGVIEDTWDGVDCALYYGGNSAGTSAKIDLVQFKYSSSDPATRWTIARLKSSSAAKGNNSAIRRMGTAFEGLMKVRNDVATGVTIRLVSNQPMDDDLVKLVKDVSDGRTLDATQAANFNALRVASDLNEKAFRTLLTVLDLSQNSSRFSLEQEILRTLAGLVESGARAVVDTLLRFIRQKMMPESAREWISVNSILIQFGFDDKGALFPCPPQLQSTTSFVKREISADVVDALRGGSKYVCLHGIGGSGKTTVLRELKQLLPSGSQMIIFDCYGAGRYLDSDAYRHRPKDAFLQLNNELASAMRVPLLLTRSDTVDYPREFAKRLNLAADVLSKEHKDALIVVAIDAADNSITAAQSLTPPERSFVSDIIRLGELPHNVRLVITTRTGGLSTLNLPVQFETKELAGFTSDETKAFVRSFWPAASDSWIDDFHHHSFQTPRVQFYALSQCGTDFHRALSFLLPNGKRLSDVFELLLLEAQRKAGSTGPLTSFCAALSALPHPAPVGEVAAVSSLTVEVISDFCADLAPGVRITKEGVGFADEDFEQFVRDRGSEKLAECRNIIAARFLDRRNSNPYAARHLASALQSAGRAKELIPIIESEPDAKAIVDIVIRREVRFERMRIAMSACADANDQSATLRILVAGAEAMRGEEVVEGLIKDFPDLAVAFMRQGAVRTVLLEPRLIGQHGPLLFHMLREDAVAGNAIAAREDERQLHAWLSKRRDGKLTSAKQYEYRWDITARDIAGEIEALLKLRGSEIAFQGLGRWRPASARLEVGDVVTHRTIATGRASLLESWLDSRPSRDPLVLPVIVKLAIAGRTIEVNRLATALASAHRRGLTPYKVEGGNSGTPIEWLDCVVAACELLATRGEAQSLIKSVVEGFTAKQHRDARSLSPADHRSLDLLMRAYALECALNDETMTLSSFLVETPVPHDVDPEERSIAKRKLDRLREFLSPLLPVYEASGRLLTGKYPSSGASSLLTKASSRLINYDYTFSRSYEASEARQHLAEAMSLLCCIPGVDEAAVWSCAHAVFGRQLNAISSQDLGAIKRFSLRRTLHDGLVTLLTNRESAILSTRTTASEKRRALLNLARVVEPLSRHDAEGLFNSALSVNEDIGADSGDEIKTFASMLSKSSYAMASEVRRQSAQQLITIVTDLALCLEDQREIPWIEIVEALVRLDTPLALAAVARWQDSALGDLDTLLPPLLRTSLSIKTLDSRQVASLLVLAESCQADLLNDLATVLPSTPIGVRSTIVEDMAREELLQNQSRLKASVVRTLESAIGSNNSAPYWLSALRDAVAFLDANTPAGPERSSSDDVEGSRAIASSFLFSSSTTEEQLLSALTASVTGRPPYSPAIPEQLASVRRNVAVKDRVHFLDLLSTLRSASIPEHILGEELTTALDAWKALPGVRQWCSTRLVDLAEQRLPMFLRYAPSNMRTLEALLKAMPNTTDLPKVLARAIGNHAHTLPVSTVYALIRQLADLSRPQDVASATLRVLATRRDVVPVESEDVIEIGDVPAAPTEAIARLIFALFSDCDVRVRWRAAHALRRAARYGDEYTFRSLVQLYNRTEELSFRGSATPFYWMAARLWTVISMQRIAHELPERVSEFAPLLITIATDSSFPHVLIRAFAKESVHHLIQSGRFSPDSSERARLDAVNEGAVPRETGKKGLDERPTSGRTIPKTRFHFNQMDTVPYWYAPAMDVFHDVTMQEFLSIADGWIVDKWGESVDVSRRNEPRERRFAPNRWWASSNDHGGEPTMEPFAIYLERHAMHCAIGELMASRPLNAREEDDSNNIEDWLAQRGTAVKPYWLADLLCPVPLLRDFWHDEISAMPNWLDSESPAQLAEEFLIDREKNAIAVQVFTQNRARVRSRDVIINSALVESTTAASLMRALQEAENSFSAYKLPDVDEIHEINVPPFRLLGWLETFDPPTGVDSKDPQRIALPPPNLRPGRNLKGMHRSLSPSGRLCWIDGEGKICLEFEAWCDAGQKAEAEGRTVHFSVGGHRLWISIDTLIRLLEDAQMDLLLSVKVVKSDRENGDERGEYRFRHDARLILLRRDGTIETSEGRTGSWQTLGS